MQEALSPPGYHPAAAERGTGMKKRMQQHMKNGAEQVAHHVFKQVREDIDTALGSEMATEVHNIINPLLKHLCTEIRMVYQRFWMPQSSVKSEHVSLRSQANKKLAWLLRSVTNAQEQLRFLESRLQEVVELENERNSIRK